MRRCKRQPVDLPLRHSRFLFTLRRLDDGAGFTLSAATVPSAISKQSIASTAASVSPATIAIAPSADALSATAVTLSPTLRELVFNAHLIMARKVLGVPQLPGLSRLRHLAAAIAPAIDASTTLDATGLPAWPTVLPARTAAALLTAQLREHLWTYPLKEFESTISVLDATRDSEWRLLCLLRHEGYKPDKVAMHRPARWCRAVYTVGELHLLSPIHAP